VDLVISYALIYIRLSQSIKIDIANKSIQSISIADFYRLLSAIDNDRSESKKFYQLLLIEKIANNQ